MDISTEEIDFIIRFPTYPVFLRLAPQISSAVAFKPAGL